VVDFDADGRGVDGAGFARVLAFNLQFGVGRGGRKPSGSRSPSRYPHCRNALNTRSARGWRPFEVSTTAVADLPLAVLDFWVIGIQVLG